MTVGKIRQALQRKQIDPELIFPRHVGFEPIDYGKERIARKGLERLRWRLERYEPIALSVYNGRTPVRASVHSPLRIPPNPQQDGELEQTAILTGGDPFSPAELVQPGVLSAVRFERQFERQEGNGESPFPIPHQIAGRRLALADWIVAPENPLTARVMVNRIWLWHFGRPLAGNPNNFGATGQRPTHPELLDELAGRFIDSGWSIKTMHRLLMNSEAYRRAATHPAPERLTQQDPEGTSYAVFPPRRLTAEELRDAMLSVTGELNSMIGGIPARPEMNPEAALQPRQVMGTFAEAWQPAVLPQQRHRRSIRFRQAGQSGADIARNWEHLAYCVDDICFYRGCQVDSVNHPTAMYQMNTGNRFGGDPALGAWMTYGLGTPNENLPGFVVLPEVSHPQGGASNWGNGFLPAHYQGTPLRATGSPILDLRPLPEITRQHQRENLDLLTRLNARHAEQHPEHRELAARMEAYELAFRMQVEVPGLLDLNQESAATWRMYGIDQDSTDRFGRKCLLARRLVEKGVRFVQLYAGTWDSHDYIERAHGNLIRQVDQPIAALLTDLKQRGLLESTLVVWCGEFGRSPDNGIRGGTAYGRDHNPDAMTIWLAGGGVNAGATVGATDETGATTTSAPLAYAAACKAALSHRPEITGVDAPWLEKLGHSVQKAGSPRK